MTIEIIRFSSSPDFLYYFLGVFWVFGGKCSVSFEIEKLADGFVYLIISPLVIWSWTCILIRFDSSSNADLFCLYLSLYSSLHIFVRVKVKQFEKKKSMQIPVFLFIFYLFGLFFSICVSSLSTYSILLHYYTVHITSYYYYHDFYPISDRLCVCVAFITCPASPSFQLCEKKNEICLCITTPSDAAMYVCAPVCVCVRVCVCEFV